MNKRKIFLIFLSCLFFFKLNAQMSDITSSPKLTAEQIAKHPADKWFTAERPDYSELDARIKTLAKNEESPQAVARIICEGLTTDIEKARAIFDWLSFNIAYDTSYSTHDGEKAFKKRKGVCQGYAELFQLMADEAGLKSEMIIGTGYGGPGVGRGGHAWNMVKLPDRDLLLDSCWGAGYVTGSSFKFKFAPAWFDTHPAAFVYTHLPNDLDDECLYPYLKNKEFTRLAWTIAEKFYPYGDIDPVENYRKNFCNNDENLPVILTSLRNASCWSKYISTGPELTDGFFITDFEISISFLKTFLTQNELQTVLNKENYEHQIVSAATDLPLHLIAKYCNERSLNYDLEKCYTITGDEASGYKIECDYSKCGFRLPTKNEWLTACGTQYLDSEISDKVFSDSVWYNKNSGGRIKIVKQSKENENGLCDMLGNVSELCYDEESEKYVFMGGNIFSSRQEIQSLVPVPYDNYIENKGAHGFRLVFNAPKTAELQYLVANLYKDSTILEKNTEEYRKWLELSINGGNATAMTQLAEIYYNQATEESYEKCYDLCLKASESEQPYSLYILGMMYKFGKHVEKNEKRAFEYFERSANKGYVSACYKVSQYYKEGVVTKQDDKKYFYWLNYAIDGGYDSEDAMIELARCYQKGTGCEADITKAFKIFETLVKKKDASIVSLVEYADCYAQGLGCRQNWYTAVNYYKTAREKGSIYAKAKLADCAFYARGMDRDIPFAVNTYKEIIDAGYSAFDYEEKYEYYNAVWEAINLYEDKCANLLSVVPKETNPADYIKPLLSISTLSEQIQGTEFSNSALLRGLSLDEVNNKVIAAMKHIVSGEEVYGKTLIIINPYKGKEFTGLQKLVFTSDCFNEKKYKVNGEYYKYDKAFYEYYDNIIFLQKEEADLNCIDDAFKQMNASLKTCSEVDLMLFSTDYFANDSSYVASYKEIAQTMIDKGSRPRIIIFGNKTDSLQQNINKSFSQEYVDKINVFGTPCNMQGELACGFRNDKLFIVQITEKMNSRHLLIYLDETGWAPEPNRKDSTFVQNQTNLNKMTGLGLNKSGTISKPGKMVMHYKVCK